MREAGIISFETGELDVGSWGNARGGCPWGGVLFRVEMGGWGKILVLVGVL